MWMSVLLFSFIHRQWSKKVHQLAKIQNWGLPALKTAHCCIRAAKMPICAIRPSRQWADVNVTLEALYLNRSIMRKCWSTNPNLSFANDASLHSEVFSVISYQYNWLDWRLTCCSKQELSIAKPFQAPSRRLKLDSCDTRVQRCWLLKCHMAKACIKFFASVSPMLGYALVMPPRICN